MLHTFAVYVDNKPGVLNRVASLFRRRAFNIESLTVGHTELSGLSRMTIVVDTDERGARLVEANLYKLLPVRRVDNITRVTAPTIVIYGSADTTVPPEQSRMVADHAALATRVVVVDRADHNDPALSRKPAIDAVIALA